MSLADCPAFHSQTLHWVCAAHCLHLHGQPEGREVEGDWACLVRACQMPAEPTRLLRQFKLKLQAVLLMKGTAISVCCCLLQAGH